MPTLEYDETGQLKPPIGLQSPNEPADNREKTRFEWNDAVGNKVKKDIIVFKHGTVEELLLWKNSIENVLNEQGVTGTTNIISTFNRVLGNPAKNHYNNGVQQARHAEDRRVATEAAAGRAAVTNYTNTHAAGLQAIGQMIFPDEAYTAQRTWLQLTVRKPIDMTIRAFVFRIETINDYLPAFPTTSGQVAVALNEMELTELIWRAIPRKWQVRLHDKRIKRHNMTRSQFIAEIETIQAVEMQTKALEKRNKGPRAAPESSHRDKDPQAGASVNKRKTNKHKRKKTNGPTGQGSPPDDHNKHYCLRHGWNPSHVTDKCKVLIAEADKLKRQHAAGSKESRAKTRATYHGMVEKDLNALIDERIAEKNNKKSTKSLKFSSLKEARKYIAACKNDNSSSSSDSE